MTHGKIWRVALAFMAAICCWTFSLSFAQNNDYLRQQQQQQQWQRQQDQQRQQQEQQRQQQQQAERQRMQDQQRQQMQAQQRQQMQDQQRQQMQAQQRQQMQDQQRQQMQTQQRQQLQQQQQSQQRQQMQTQQQNAQRQQLQQQQQNQQRQAQQQTAQQQRAQLQQQGKLGKDGKPTGIVFSNGVAKMNRPLTPGEIQRGFTGKVTTDGRALIKFQGRVFTVPASRVSGLSARLAANQNQLRAAKWTAQQQGVVSQRMKALTAANDNKPRGPSGGAGGNGGGGGGSGCTPPGSAKCQFNEAAARKATSAAVQSRIDFARLSKVKATQGEASREYQYAPRVREREVEDPGGHRFPYSFDRSILQSKPVSLRGGAEGYALRGHKNGNEVVYNVIVKDGLITHRDMVPSAEWSRRSKSFGWNQALEDISWENNKE